MTTDAYPNTLHQLNTYIYIYIHLHTNNLHFYISGSYFKLGTNLYIPLFNNLIGFVLQRKHFLQEGVIYKGISK